MNKIRKNSAASAVVTVESPQHEIAQVGRSTVHRIISGGLTSQWFTYQQIAVLKTPLGVLHAVTDYYHGTLPTNKVFYVTEA